LIMKQVQNIPSEGRVIFIDKPLGWTSFDVVKKVRYYLKEKKVGHGGTLDPLATGLLILCTGKKTKQINTYMELEKEYTGKMVIGKTTPSVDLETRFDSESPWEHINPNACYNAILELTGTISQIPPAHSAVKVDGKRAYKLARKGEEVKIKSREVLVKEFSLPEINLPEISFKIVCARPPRQSTANLFISSTGISLVQRSMRIVFS